jgi:molybdopterin-guanine dinucleotide biosynthesis protein A
VARALDALGAVCDDVVVVTHLPEIGIALGARTLGDRVPEAGPLGGLESALRYARALRREGALVLGCDTPLVPPALLALLLDEAGRRGPACRAVVPAAGPRGVQPLCAWYSVACLDAVESRLADGDRSLRGLLTAVGAQLVPPERMSALCDLRIAFRGANTPQELRELEVLAKERKWPVSRSPLKPFWSSPSASPS